MIPFSPCHSLLSPRPHTPRVPAQTMGEEGREHAAEAIKQEADAAASADAKAADATKNAVAVTVRRLSLLAVLVTALLAGAVYLATSSVSAGVRVPLYP